MNNQEGESKQALHEKIDAIMEHGDPAMREMLRDLIFEFHNQVMVDPKSRVSMKEKMKSLGGKIVKLPLVFSPEKRTSVKTTKPRTVNLISVVAVLLVAVIFISWITMGAKHSDAPVRLCNIKGNINTDGEKIYHLPNSKWYIKTFVEESKGERWFCSEDEARGAGWRGIN